MTVRPAAGADRPSELALRHDPSQLHGHFALARSLPLEPAGWSRRVIDGWQLVHEARLPARVLLAADGAEVGWILGNPLDLEAVAAVGEVVHAPPGDPADWLYRLGGRFAAVILQPSPRVYPDAGGGLPVLFDAGLRCAASSPFLLPSPGGAIPDSALVEALAVCTTGSWFVLGATPHQGANLLLPNHVLDLTTWRQTRLWPTAPPEPGDPEALVERVAAVLERTLAAAAAEGRPNVGFTAGGDSRSLLACGRGVLDRLRFFTVALPDELGATDLATAPALAERLGLEHRVLPWREPSIADVDLFMYRTGCLVGEQRGREATRSYDQLGGGEVYVSGVGAEMARGIGWRRHDRPGLRLGPGELLSRFGFFRPPPELLRRAHEWLDALPPGFDGLDALTLFHVEMRLGGWGGPLTTAYPDAYSYTLYPYAHRDIVDAVLRLPWRHRLEGRLPEDVIASRWPALLDVPVNRPPFRVAVRRGVRNSVRAARNGFARTPVGSLVRWAKRRRAGVLRPPA